MRRWIALGLLVLPAIVLSCAPAEDDFERVALDEAEELSESLANDLHALSVAVLARESAAIEKYVGETIRVESFPTRPGATQPVFKWIGEHDWTVDPSSPPLRDRGAFLSSLEELLDHFSEIEDVRFKVKQAEFDATRDGHGSAHVKIFIIGRDDRGKREWLKASLRIEVLRAGEEPWRITALDVDSMESKVADRDLFSEVALPARISTIFPPFGVGANSGFISHGAAVADVNGDGLLDIATTGVEQNYLYLNRGDGRFDDVSADSLVGFAPPGSGALFLD